MIKEFGLRDVFTLRQLQTQGVAFDLRRLLLYSPMPTRSALLGYLTRHHLGAVTYVLREHDGQQLCGFCQAWPRGDQPEWDLGFVAPSLDHHDSAVSLWQKMLPHLVAKAAESGALRVYARGAEDALAEDVLRQSGFVVVGREEVFVLNRDPGPAPAPRGLRQATPEDAWAIQELYRQVVPKPVQQAEGCSTRWTVPYNRWLRGPEAADEYVWAEKGRLIACLRLCSTFRGYWLEVVVRPEYRADTLPYLKYVLTLTECSADSPIYCPVPDYGVGLGWLLRTIGFESYARQVLMVAHTAARVPVRRQMVVPGLERGVDVGQPVGHVTQARSGLAASRTVKAPTSLQVIV